MPDTRTRAMIAIAATLILLRLRWPSLQIDAVTVGLLLVAILPWLMSDVASAGPPGGWKVQFRELRQVMVFLPSL
jgi:hypothetical protein